MRIAELKRHVKIAVSLIYYVSVGSFVGCLRLMGVAIKPRLTILYYHGLPANYRSQFARQLDLLERMAHVLPASYRGELPPDRKSVAITFDDAFQSVLENAVPELVTRSFHATIFVPVDLVGRHPNWEMEKGCSDLNEVVMTAEQLRALNPATVSLGSHTKTHASITDLDNQRARDEIESSRYQLGELCGRNIQTFSFPYGHHDASAVGMCKRAGYEFVYSIVPEGVDTTKLKILRGRTKAEPSDSLVEFFLKINGAYGWMAHVAAVRNRLSLNMGTKQFPVDKLSHVKGSKKC